MSLVGLIGYIVSSFAFFIFILLLLAAKNNTLAGRLVLIASVITMVANSLAAFQLEYLFSLRIVLIFESIKLILWPMLLISNRDSINTLSAILRHKHFIKYLFIFFGGALTTWYLSFNTDDGTRYLFMFFLVFNLWQIVLLEQVFRNASNKAKWALWPLIIALGSGSVFEFVMFAQAYMVNKLDYIFWHIRPYVFIFSIPFLLISIRRMKDWSVRVFVSRNIVFYSSMLLMAGGYLVVMASAGYVINYVGGEWGDFISVTFLVLASLVLAALIITDTLRRKVKVFIAKNFFANKYEYRDEWLDLISKIETTSAESYYQMATNIMKAKLGAEAGAILKKVNSHSFQIKYCDGFVIDEALSQQLLMLSKFCHKKGWIVDIQEYARNPNLYDDLDIDLSIFKEQSVNVVVPIFIGKAFYGFFTLAKRKECQPLNWEDRDLLFAISKQLGNFISLHEANDRLAESKQFDAFNRMSAFLVHDLKNVQGQLSLIGANAKKHRDNPEFINDVFETVESATNRLDKMLTQLRNKQVAQSKNTEQNINQLLEKVIEHCNVRQPKVTLEVVDDVRLVINGETFQSVIHHLIQNAQEACENNGWVKIHLSATLQDIIIKISDNGCGMSDDFIKTRLFKPFDTTKGNAGMGIGVFEAKQFFEGNAGSLEVSSNEGQGTIFTLTLPINPSYDG